MDFSNDVFIFLFFEVVFLVLDSFPNTLSKLIFSSFSICFLEFEFLG